MSTSHAEHDQHSSFIKTPQQLLVVILLSFLVPIIGIILLVQLVVGASTGANPGAHSPDRIAARVAPVGKVEIGAPAAPPGARSGDEIVKAVCAACHQAGVANAPKIGDAARWGQLAKDGLPKLVAEATKGKGAMPPKGGAADLTETELARAIAYMANQSGQNLKEPATKQEPAAKPAAAAKK